MKTITFDEKLYQLVPKEPTDVMLQLGCKAGLDLSVLLNDEQFSTEKAIYKAILQAAPKSL